jgi:hypothetical protein
VFARECVEHREKCRERFAVPVGDATSTFSPAMIRGQASRCAGVGSP